jgi:hypothetical protein
MTKCTECLDVFKWDDDVVNVGYVYFHKKCVELVPSGYVAYVNDEYIGEVEHEDMACLVLDTDDYQEDES